MSHNFKQVKSPSIKDKKVNDAEMAVIRHKDQTQSPSTWFIHGWSSSSFYDNNVSLKAKKHATTVTMQSLTIFWDVKQTCVVDYEFLVWSPHWVNVMALTLTEQQALNQWPALRDLWSGGHLWTS